MIIRGICCLKPQREGVSKNIAVKSVVGDYLEHSRLFYFHNAGDPIIYGGSADIMVRSFERRIECLFEILDPSIKKEAICILDYNLRDNTNSYNMLENGDFIPVEYDENSEFNLHKEFFKLTPDIVQNQSLLF